MSGDPELITRCLELCAHAEAHEGEARSAALSALRDTLEALRRSTQEPDRSPREHGAYARILAQLREPIITMDLAGYVTGWNRSAERLLGYTPEEAIGQHILFLYAEDEEASDVPELFLEQGSSYMEVRRRKKSGEVFWAGLSLSLIRDDDGEPVGIAGHLSEITDRISAEEMLRLHTRIIEDSDQCIMITDAQDRIVSVNAAFSRVTGYNREEALGMTPDLLRSGVHDEGFRGMVHAAMHGAGPWQGEIIGRRKDGSLFPQSVSIGTVRNDKGEVTHAFSIFTDISADKEAAEQFDRLVNYDNLTGLPNRRLLNQLLTQAISSSVRRKGNGGLIVIDLNRFTSINEGLGPHAGDELLRQVAQRLRRVLRDADVLARTGADEFVALVEVEKREHCGVVADKLLTTLHPPFSIETHEIYVTACAGIAVFPEDASSAATLLQVADVTMKRCRQLGESGYLFYSPEMNHRAKEHLKLENDLRKALGNGSAAPPQLSLYYQPKVSLRTGRIVGAEALLRWTHPEQGPISPARFVPLAEETGLILELGAWVLEDACRQIRAWRAQGLSPPPIAVNLSARQFDRELPARISEVLERHGVSSEELKLELTESLLMGGAENVIPVMNELVAMGFSLALDDFGTGFSSLSYLRRYPISTLKIDRSFVEGIPREADDCAIARAIVTMGQQLHQEIVAEGVETVEQMNFLRELGCDQLQGYLFSPPVTAAEFSDFVQGDRRLTLDD
ncbi:MAG: EAL domain-containing protein [Rhodocyclaceae bacterium]|jgi:diguanylate cyclase (GGDEF)-like protein/PAS domain S-box-containing protein|nr:EAL domain-containing protein [Rhodocyclaceae bacterium]